MMTKRTALVAMLSLATANMLAGGLFTNTNQNPIFFRQPAQNAVIGVQGAYYDPAGLVFMNSGWHFGLGEQMAYQTRTITSTYAPFMYNADNPGQTTKEFKGETFAPVIPSLDLVYNQDKWAASFHFGVMSGGGSCAFDDGLGSFEAPMALIPFLANNVVNSMIGQSINPFSSYEANINFTGKSYGFGGQLNYSYKVIDNSNLKLSLAAGVRLNYLKNQYDGGIFDYKLNTINMTQLPAPYATMLGTISGALLQVAGDKEVSCTQTALALTPILNAHLQAGIVDFAVKYEFLTKVTLENETSINTTGIASYNDGVSSRADIPALLSVGLNVSILPQLRAAAAMNVYFDKQANYGGRQEKLGGNTLEWTAGLEYDLSSKLTVSLGTQITRFDFGENYDYLTDSSFSLPSWCLGAGFRYQLTDRLAIDFSAFNTFYDTATKTYSDYGNALQTFVNTLSGMAQQGVQLPISLDQNTIAALSPYTSGTDEFKRTSLNFGLGIVWDF